MAISKNITLTVDGYTCKLSSNLQFYRGDALHLIFTVNEYGVMVTNGKKTRELMPIVPLSGYLLIETPINVDFIESVAVVDDEIHFHIDSRYTDFVGISRMQIILTDENCCQITLPEFNFEIRENITETKLNLAKTVMVDNDNIVLLSDDGEGITAGNTMMAEETPIAFKYIRDLQEKKSLNGTERILVQDDENTKFMNTDTLYDFIIEHFDDTIQDNIKSVIGTNGNELKQLKTMLIGLILSATDDLVAIEKLKRDYEAKLNEIQGSDK